jgi:hypothetical protein
LVEVTMDTDRELQFGPGMRAERLTEAAFLIAAIFTQDVRFAYVTFILTLLQAVSPRWAPVAQAVARFVRFRGQHRIGDMYFDLSASRGSYAISLVSQSVCLALIAAGFPVLGFVLLTVPTASVLISPILGFCAGCWFYVLGRDWFGRRGWLKEGFDEHHDISIGGQEAGDQSELRPTAQR